MMNNDSCLDLDLYADPCEVRGFQTQIQTFEGDGMEWGYIRRTQL